jgi:hypothetical protein
MSLAYTLGRATSGLWRALSGRPRRTPPPPLKQAPARPPSWRDARSEGAMLQQAVEAMEGHTDMLAQIADAWLLSANLKQFDQTRFYANVARSRDIAGSLDDQCMAVVVELRALRQQRDQAGWFEERTRRAHRLADRTAHASALLHQRLTAIAHARGLDPSMLMEAASRDVRPPADLPALVDAYDDRPQPMGAWLP